MRPLPVLLSSPSGGYISEAGEAWSGLGWCVSSPLLPWRLSWSRLVYTEPLFLPYAVTWVFVGLRGATSIGSKRPYLDWTFNVLMLSTPWPFNLLTVDKSPLHEATQGSGYCGMYDPNHIIYSPWLLCQCPRKSIWIADLLGDGVCLAAWTVSEAWGSIGGRKPRRWMSISS